MTKSYFQAMFICFLISFLVLGGATYLKLPPWVAMLGGVVPLSYYHIFYLRSRAKGGLSQSAIDSVYYFGFLVTVAALGISAISIAVGGAAGNINTIVYQFGVGLFATGYAIIARMDLSSMSMIDDTVSPEAIMARYIKSSMEFVTNVEMASSRFAEFSKTIMAKTSDVTEATRIASEKSMFDVAKVFENEMKTTLAMARDGLTEIRGLVAETSFVVEREVLTNSIKATVEMTTQLNQALDELTSRSREGAQATLQSTLASENLDITLRKFSSQIDNLVGQDGMLTKSAESLLTSSDTVAMCNVSMSTAVVSLNDIAILVKDTGPTFKHMRTLTKKAGEQLDALASASEKLDTALAKFTGAALASDTLAVGINKVTAALSPLSINAEIFTVQLERASNVSERFEQQLSTLPTQTAVLDDMGKEMAVSLKQISDAVGSAAIHAQQLSASTAESSKTIECVKELFAGTENLQTSIFSLQKLFNDLSNSVLVTQEALSESSNGIKSSIAGSTEALEADVKRSTHAVSLLTDSLIQVAQTIIDRTKQPEVVNEAV
ncbi:MAG: hypothetical protein WCS87_11645 [Methylococcaceae bacterium]